MAYKYYNPNPLGKSTGDCVIRAISKVLNQSWDKTYWELCEHGFQMGDWGDSNTVWDSYLRSNGFVRKVIPNTCPDCYTVRQFTKDCSHGVFLLSTGNHTVAIKDGNHYDSWDSGHEVPIFYYERR